MSKLLSAITMNLKVWHIGSNKKPSKRQHIQTCKEFIPGVVEDEYMAAHGQLQNGQLLVFRRAGVFHVQPHDLGVSLLEPFLVHGEDALHFRWIVGVHRLDRLLAMDLDSERPGEVVHEVHGYAAREKKELDC